MKFLVICVLISFAANKVFGEFSFLDVKFTPLLRFGRILLGDLTRPRTFERGLKISIKDNVRNLLFKNAKHYKRGFLYNSFISF